MTVVVETTGSRTFVGRYDRADERGVHLLDVGVHDVGSDMDKGQYIGRSAKFGIRTEHRHLVVAPDEVVRITQLSSWEASPPRG
jgi:formyltetrahydrofolate hydrolase